METLTREELRQRKKEIIRKIIDGAIFIHPTDTIYGLGCNALSEKSVQNIRKLKERPTLPLSTWAPSQHWIEEHCQIDASARKWLSQLPGPYTLLLPLKDRFAVAPSVHLHSSRLGVRIPKHWFGKIVEETGIPIITTSANKHGKPFMTSLENLDKDIEKGVEFMIYEGPKEGKPSTIVDVEKEEMKRRRFHDEPV